MAVAQVTGGVREAASRDEPRESWLIARIAEGDAAAFRELYERFSRPLFAYLAAACGDPPLAEEVLQDTFVAAWRGARGFEARSSASTWLFGIARRRLRDRRRSLPPPATPIDAVLEPVAAERPDVEALARVELSQLVDALRELSADHREVLLLTFAHGLDQAETARVLGIPVGTVKSRLNHARRALAARVRPAEAEA